MSAGRLASRLCHHLHAALRDRPIPLAYRYRSASCVQLMHFADTEGVCGEAQSRRHISLSPLADLRREAQSAVETG